MKHMFPFQQCIFICHRIKSLTSWLIFVEIDENKFTIGEYECDDCNDCNDVMWFSLVTFLGQQR